MIGPLTLVLLAFLPSFLSAGPLYTIPYDNDFVDPAYFLSHTFGNSTAGAQQTVVEWADYLNTQGPWSESRSTNNAGSP